ncbi:unnamed protein product [Didymodactylos carnosus]|uniref:FAD-binding PCMH-type domain-containing protein n=1 Tax=Didymodactylos carnosus TaxID=1234261 RepID=A0A814NY85_9BILA|nr:unnamed protein product [Didymodactylos carnosus]CAF3864716.1 unnamed protein product [Didymodactylos carnosus]
MSTALFYSIFSVAVILSPQLTVTAQPSAAVCDTTWSNENASAAVNAQWYNANACAVATAQWNNASWRSDQVGAMQNANWENSSCSIYIITNSSCNQGSVPILAVNATWPEHVQTTVEFASANNLRLVIKTTGHDYLGRSTAADSLLLWLHYMKNMTFMENFTTCDGSNLSNAIRVGAGVQWGQVYAWLTQYNLTAIGGAASTVCAAGGYLQGGGHSPLSRWKGMAADQVLEFDVIMANGQRQTVNACQNTDLFWALRGGGGGTFAIVLSVVLRTYPSPPLVVGLYSITASNGTTYSSLIHNFIGYLPTLADRGWAGYFNMKDTNLVISFIQPYGKLTEAYAILPYLLTNNTDSQINYNFTTAAPSFYDFFIQVLAPGNPTGYNVLLGSRLIPETIVRNQSYQLAETFLQANGLSQTGSTLLGHLVAGGQVSNVSSTNNNSVNPVWRTSLLHMVFAVTWPDEISESLLQEIPAYVRSQVAILQTMAGGSQSGCYLNEADPNELNWQQKFFGTQANYDRLKSIKQTADPLGLFVCKDCVGSDDWSSDLNCLLTSSATKVGVTIMFAIIEVVVLAH